MFGESNESLADAGPVGERGFLAGHELNGELGVAGGAQGLDALFDLRLGGGEGGRADQVGGDERPFLRLEERSPGVGLGLAVAKGFAEAMGGTIAAVDTKGGGLTMRVTLPAVTSGDRAVLGAGQ